MKKLLFFLTFLIVTLIAQATTYYVAPSTASPAGSDSNDGSLAHPWFTLNHALGYVSAGDIIYMRGGTYHYNTTGTVISGKNGTAGNYINIWNYPGENPVIDYGNETFPSQLIGIYLTNCSYIYLKGIRVTHINQPATGGIAQYGVLLDGSSVGCTYSKFEQMRCDHIGGWGFVISKYSSHNLFLNCDGDHCADPNTGSYNGDPYGWSDGFEMPGHGASMSTDITFDGCRAWNNSDDGWDMRQADGVYYLKNCWAFHNGVREDGVTKGGDGECFKLGGSTTQTSSITRTVTNCIAAYGASGYSPEPDISPTYWFGLAVYNCVSYHNQIGVNFEYGNVNIVRNNIVYAWTTSANWGWGAQSTHDHNAGLDAGITLTNADFLSVDSAGRAGPRLADGSLPVLNFLKPSAGSQLRGAGVAISGLTIDGAGHTYGTPPSIGAYE